jgi:hypothetical protein
LSFVSSVAIAHFRHVAIARQLINDNYIDRVLTAGCW